MNMRNAVRLLGTLTLGALLAAPVSSSAEGSTAKPAAGGVSEKARETGRTIKDYTLAQRDQAVKQAKSALDDADARIRRLESRLDADWDRMDAAARKRSRATLDALRRERDDLAEWYGGLKHGSAEAWDEVKNGFARSYDQLGKSFAKARKEF